MISAIVLAAGVSKRMGQPKMLMPWGPTTVIGKVLETLQETGVKDIVVVTGGLHDKLASKLDENIHYLQNKDFSNGEMLTSVKVGLQNIASDQEAVLIVLGDQPQIQAETVRKIIERYQATHHSIIVPSYHMHRGHPWLVAKAHWQEIVQLEMPETLRDFLNTHSGEIDYIQLDTPSILADIDTLNDYYLSKP
jgi:molybdenum cofactor cytidylyltransferase